jgi:arabinose-5-phosphate isomerase
VSAAPLPLSRPRDAAREVIAAGIDALQRLEEGLGEPFDDVAGRLAALRGKVVTIGVGKSGMAAAKVAATLRSVGVPALTLSTSDVLHGDLGIVEAGDLAMLFSKSGGTQELLVLVPHLRGRYASIVAVVGQPGSPLARQADVALDASVEREGCPLGVAPMASVLAAQALGDALAAAVMALRGFDHTDFARLHPGGALGTRLTLSVGDCMRRGDELPVIGDDATLRDAVIEITRTGYGAVCVATADGTLRGFLTDGDVRRALLASTDIAGIGVGEVMTHDPLALTPELPLSEALLVLERRPKAFLTAPVVDADGRCVGLLRLHDTVRAHLPR